jgi:hypothetical protein
MQHEAAHGARHLHANRQECLPQPGRLCVGERGARPTVLEGSGVMHNRELAADHLRRAGARLRALDLLHDAASWADVVRESQDVVELALKRLLRAFGIDPPRIRDVADVLIADRARLPGRSTPTSTGSPTFPGPWAATASWHSTAPRI